MDPLALRLEQTKGKKIMGEYKDLERQLARIGETVAYLNGYTYPVDGRSRPFVGVADPDEGESGFVAKVAEWREVRPTIAGALLAIELKLAEAIDARVVDQTRLRELRDALLLPEIKMVGGT